MDETTETQKDVSIEIFQSLMTCPACGKAEVNINRADDEIIIKCDDCGNSSVVQT